MNTFSLESKLVTAKHLNDRDTLNAIYIDMSNKLAKMDRWFDKFLDMFDDKLSSCDSSDPVKKLYNAKFDEYSQVAKILKMAEIYLKG